MLRSPDFGNSWRLVTNTLFQRTANGQLRVYKGNFPSWEQFTVSFSAITQAEITEFRTFVQSNAGKIVNLIDFEGRAWTGVIISPKIIIKLGMGECNYQVSFDFEGAVSG